MRAKRTERRNDANMRTKRVHRRGSHRAQRPSWVGCLRRLNRVLSSSSRVIDATREALGRASEHATECPVRTTRDLRRLSAGLPGALNRLNRAVRAIRETTDSMMCAPESRGSVPRLLTEATTRWVLTAIALECTSQEIFDLHED